MSGAAKEWLVVGIFFLAFFVFTYVEARWLSGKLNIPIGRSATFAFSSNIFAVTVGFFISFIIFAVMLAMAWDGSLQTVPGNDPSIWVTVAVAVAAPILVLFLAKRIMLRFMSLPIPGPWLYSILSSLAFFIVVLGATFGIAAIF